jgi:hypothetical protein
MIIRTNVLTNCFNHNPDGAGFAYLTDDGDLVVEKGFFTLDSFLEAYKPHEDKQALLHFRIKTHGDLSADNCHPFVVEDGMAFIHNGIISASRNHAVMSDTAVFNEDIVKPLVAQFGEGALENNVVKTLIEKYIGGSKLAFIDNKSKNFNIFNKELGNVANEVWFSNFSWQDRKVTPPNQYNSYPATVYTPYKGHKVWTSSMYGDYDDEEYKAVVVDKLESYDKKTVLKEGDLVKFTWKHTSLSGIEVLPGYIGEIETLYSDRLIDVLVYPKQGKIKKEFITAVQFYTLELATEEDIH